MTTSLSDEFHEVLINSDREEIFIDAIFGTDNKKKVSITVLGCCGNCYVTNIVDEDDLMEAIRKSKESRR